PEYEGVVFRSATILELHLNKDTVQAPTSASSPNPASTPAPAPVFTKEQVVSFARSVRSLTPAATCVTIAYEFVSDSSENASDLHSTLVTELYRGGITRMGIYSITGRSPLTLQRLAIKPASKDNWRTLLYGGTEDPASFGCLEYLTIRISKSSHTRTWTAAADVAPFPILSTLNVSGGYPFDDDVLFRGNGQTMQSLRLPFSALARNALGRFNVLKRNGAGELKDVCIGRISNADNTFIAGLAVVLIKRQIHSVLEVAAVLSTTCDTTDVHIYKAIIDMPRTSVLQHLRLGMLRIGVVGVISIASALPSLVSLTCDLKEPQITAMTSPGSKSLGDLRKRHLVWKSNLREIRVPYSTTTTATDLAKIAKIIAILHPKLVHVDIAPQLRNAFS
ncbi:hypothetical protein GGI21_000865, partial [Coemansia aciculifera]